jgi:hypothetical protein
VAEFRTRGRAEHISIAVIFCNREESLSGRLIIIIEYSNDGNTVFGTELRNLTRRIQFSGRRLTASFQKGCDGFDFTRSIVGRVVLALERQNRWKDGDLIAIAEIFFLNTVHSCQCEIVKSFGRARKMRVYFLTVRTPWCDDCIINLQSAVFFEPVQFGILTCDQR